MRKLTATFIAVLLSLGFATPAESNSTKWTAYQKTLATYSGSDTSLTSLQKSQIRATLDKAPLAEKFICTGIRYFDQPMSINIMVRKRAKEACEYAKELKPELSTWYQNKPTKARSYAGKVLLTVKSPENPDGLPTRFISETSNPWLDRCEQLNYSSNGKWADAYREILESVCSVEKIDRDVINVVYAPNVDPLDPMVREYVDTAYFAYTYWAQYVPDDFPRWTFVMASPEDEKWWEENRLDYTVIDDDIDGCRYFDENNFCSFKYSYDEDQTTFNGSMNLMVIKQGSPANVDIAVDPAHNAPHWYQKAHSFQHWHFYLIEGHATLYEIAFQTLKRGRDNFREGFIWQAHKVDQRKFNPTDTNDVAIHLSYCDKNGGECNHFKYGGAALLHEKLILDYGYESYLTWNEKMESISSAKKRILGPAPGIGEYLTIFEQHFGIEYQQYLDEQLNPFILESFNHYYSIWESQGVVSRR